MAVMIEISDVTIDKFEFKGGEVQFTGKASAKSVSGKRSDIEAATKKGATATVTITDVEQRQLEIEVPGKGRESE